MKDKGKNCKVKYVINMCQDVYPHQDVGGPDGPVTGGTIQLR
jgi:hypothetical protein